MDERGIIYLNPNDASNGVMRSKRLIHGSDVHMLKNINTYYAVIVLI